MEFDPERGFLARGATFHGRYQVVRCLKTGGMGAIYEVIHLETRRRRALKLMLPALAASVDTYARFKLEATIAADIDSEHIVETFDAGVDGETGIAFLVMELLRGEDLGAIVREGGKLPPGEVVLLLSQAASALDKTHAAGVVHRDLKPENLFVTRRDDGTPKLKILDFGIAKVIAESGQGAAKTKVLGTPLYMSPEQIRGEGTIGPRADLHALAHIAFTLLVGKAYWADEAEAEPLYELMTKIVGGGPVAATKRAQAYGGAVPDAFDAWFAKATHVVPEERFAGAAALVEALEKALDVAAPRAAATALGLGTTRRLDAPSDPPQGPDTVVIPDQTSPIPNPAGITVPAPTLSTLTEAAASMGIPRSPTRSAGRWLGVGALLATAVVVTAVLTPRLADRSKPDAVAASSGVSSAPRPSAEARAPEPSREPSASAAAASAAPVGSASAAVASSLRPPRERPVTRPAASATAAPNALPPTRSLD